MIRLAYAVLRRDPVEVGVSLAYWATVALQFPHPVAGEPFTTRPADVLKRMREDPEFRELKHSGIGLWARMNLMGVEPVFSPVIDWLAVGDDSLRMMARDSLALFIETDDLRALHAVTACQAMRELMPFPKSGRPAQGLALSLAGGLRRLRADGVYGTEFRRTP